MAKAEERTKPPQRGLEDEQAPFNQLTDPRWWYAPQQGIQGQAIGRLLGGQAYTVSSSTPSTSYVAANLR